MKLKNNSSINFSSATFLLGILFLLKPSRYAYSGVLDDFYNRVCTVLKSANDLSRPLIFHTVQLSEKYRRALESVLKARN